MLFISVFFGVWLGINTAYVAVTKPAVPMTRKVPGAPNLEACKVPDLSKPPNRHCPKDSSEPAGS